MGVQVYVRMLFALAMAVHGLVVGPAAAHAVPGFCPPACDAIPDSAWIETGSIPLFPVYRWPGLDGVAATAKAPRFEFESWCASPGREEDPRDYAVAARAEVRNPPGQWNLSAQVLHWRGDTVTGGRDALETLEWARMALASCYLTAPAVSPSITTGDSLSLATVISDAGRRVMHAYLLADPASSSLVELALWTTLPSAVEWRGVPPDAEVLDAMALPLCAAYLGSCR
ncbi:metallo-beta-lactamase superfamily protein,putative [Mycolicibacterium aurum]|uniref:Metallo-beta-lactamase superfamily protein,putative n=1 Tax=Mycolicibacterium aurum TaxID=1791 RepID=A0A448IZL3_MYCAU|nr:metallo-beta-lactamase superfamily protein,putative [Mycolicibacterium aurum]